MTSYDEAVASLEAGDLEAIMSLTQALTAADAEWLESLVRLRKQSGLTQEDVATAWGRHKTLVSQFEQLGNDPRLSTIRRYAASAGIRYGHHTPSLDTHIHALQTGQELGFSFSPTDSNVTYLADFVPRADTNAWNAADEQALLLKASDG